MHAVRRQIVEILKEASGATVAELAEKLEMAPVSVRHHLDILQGENLISVGRVERKGNVGRPQQVYSLTVQAMALFPNNFASLAAGLVRQLKQVLPAEQVTVAFTAMAADLAKEAHPAQLAELCMEDRLEQIANFLTARGYLARWEDVAGEEGVFLLHKHNCPYSGVSGEHRELCQMDQKLVNELTGASCLRVRSMVEDGGCCTYRVTESMPVELLLMA